MIEMWHREHARVHPCAAEESELPRLLKQGWVRSEGELHTQPTTVSLDAVSVVDTLDLAIDAMLRDEARVEKQMLVRSKRGGGSAP
jgi:hypothetical protein